MASAATVPSPPRQRVLTFAERQHLSDQRRAAVLAQRQAERAKRREEQARRRTANSASPGYDPTAYAARRAAAEEPCGSQRHLWLLSCAATGVERSGLLRWTVSVPGEARNSAWLKQASSVARQELSFGFIEIELAASKTH